MLRPLALGLLALAPTAYASPPLSLSLETGWAAPPLFLEIIETVHDENQTAYLPLLRLLNSARTESMTSEQTLDTAVKLIGEHQLLPELSTFHLALALHTTVPRIEAAYSWYESNVNEVVLAVNGCSSWVEANGEGYCDSESLESALSNGPRDITDAPRFPMDRVSRPSEVYRAIFYFNPEGLEAESSGLIASLNRKAEADPTFSFIVRYRPSPDRQSRPKTKMAGYGVELALKKTDYLVVDDRNSGSATSDTQDSASTADLTSGSFEEILGTDPWADLAIPLTKSEVMDLGLKAAALIMSAPRPLDALRELSQDFPKYSAALSRRIAIPDVIARKAELMARRGVDPLAIYINGRSYSHPDLNAYSLLKAIRAEKKLATSLVSLGLTPKQSFQLLSDPVIGQKQTGEEAGEGVVDSSDRLEEGGVIVWWNDIEKDTRYKQWPSSLTGYLRPTYPGQLHTVRKNTWNVIMVLDLSLSTSLDVVTQQVAHMVQRGIPIRFGVIPMFDSEINDISMQMAKLYLYSVKTFGRGQTSQMLSELAAMTPATATDPGVVRLSLAQNAYERLQAGSTKDSLPFDQVVSPTSLSEQVSKVSSYQTRLLATKSESAAGHMFVNGKYYPFANHWTNLVQSELTNQVSFLQEHLQSGHPVNDVANFFYDLPGVPTRRSKIIVPTTGEHAMKSVNLPELFSSESHKRLFNTFLYPNDEAQATPITMWVIGDLDSFHGFQLVKDALKYLQSESCSSRIAFIHAPTTSAPASTGQSSSSILHQLVSLSALRSVSPQEVLDLIEHVNEDEASFKSRLNGPQKPLDHLRQKGIQLLGLEGWQMDHAAQNSYSTWVEAGIEIAMQLGIDACREPHLIVNGRLVGPLSPSTFTAADFSPLETYEYRKRAKPVVDLLKTMYKELTAFDRPTFADLVSSISSVMTTAYKSDEGESIFVAPPTSRSRYYESLDKGAMSFHVGDLDTAIVRVAAVLDPITEEAQVWSTLLKTASEMDNVSVSVYLEPDLQNTELKLKRFYRSSVPNALTFNEKGEQADVGVSFNNLPSEPIYTLGLDTPPAWIVSPLSSPYDLDNLQLSTVTSPIQVSFQLKQLLIEGHARELSNAPPRGLQLQLTRNGIEVSDTLVMANLGYMQFKVTPGVYDLSIRPGRGSEVYELESTGTTGWYSAKVAATGTEVTLASFEGKTVLPRFTRRKGMELADVLSEAPVSTGQVGAVWSRMKELVGISSTPSAVVKKHADINIFTVASGLLYERFASIMILSVMKHTKSSVKFWFIENFLSPTFLAFIPHLAEEYGFEYELVTYKWPHWLRAQTEKQRIIWAYKILFLDVLFPMDLDKVIFVDADQIVRTDMQELVDLDLQDHVYGYPPMGDDRHEMEGFRFWKTGYWKDALRGRPYHISALYVVDLKRFRQLATGDRLRGQYHALSADPGSLANLDQDLPNSMQDQIPIFTLDQDWLWCQTWCSDESLKTAKTIDLCQNPLTKEPKLARARQIPEWDVYDNEVARFARGLQSKARGMADSVDSLAGAVGQDAAPSSDGDHETHKIDEL